MENYDNIITNAITFYNNVQDQVSMISGSIPKSASSLKSGEEIEEALGDIKEEIDNQNQILNEIVSILNSLNVEIGDSEVDNKENPTDEIILPN